MGGGTTNKASITDNQGGEKEGGGYSKQPTGGEGTPAETRKGEKKKRKNKSMKRGCARGTISRP